MRNTTADEDATLAIKAIADMQADCTCTPGSDITLCPNYVPGDEALLEEEDWS